MIDIVKNYPYYIKRWLASGYLSVKMAIFVDTCHSFKCSLTRYETPLDSNVRPAMTYKLCLIDDSIHPYFHRHGVTDCILLSVFIEIALQCKT